MKMTGLHKLILFPRTSGVNDKGHLCVGGCDVVNLAEEFGTPLYLFDEYTLRNRCKEFKKEFSLHYPDMQIVYASKAFLNQKMALIIKEEGLGIDVVSAGELSIACSVDFPLSDVYFHGNNKTQQEMEMALDYGIGCIVLDNLYELDLLDSMLAKRTCSQRVVLRINPGVDPNTHKHTSTGILDSKFGFPLFSGQAADAVKVAMDASHLELVGFHFHLGSPLFEVEPYVTAIELVMKLAAELKIKLGFQLRDFSIGGGFAVQYVLGKEAPSVGDYARIITCKVKDSCSNLGLALPHLIVEPGRAIVAQAGVALYRVGAIKEIPGIRKYVCVDGGMSDNIRPALYDAKYETLVANKVNDVEHDIVTIAGKLCESGDILAWNAKLSSISSGDLIAMPVCGAYSISMSSNYNSMPRPAIVLLNKGQAQIIRKRESYEDLIRLDVI